MTPLRSLVRTYVRVSGEYQDSRRRRGPEDTTILKAMNEPPITVTCSYAITSYLTCAVSLLPEDSSMVRLSDQSSPTCSGHLMSCGGEKRLQAPLRALISTTP